MAGYPQFPFWILITLVKICFSRAFSKLRKNTSELVGTVLKWTLIFEMKWLFTVNTLTQLCESLLNKATQLFVDLRGAKPYHVLKVFKAIYLQSK